MNNPQQEAMEVNSGDPCTKKMRKDPKLNKDVTNVKDINGLVTLYSQS